MRGQAGNESAKLGVAGGFLAPMASGAPGEAAPHERPRSLRHVRQPLSPQRDGPAHFGREEMGAPHPLALALNQRIPASQARARVAAASPWPSQRFQLDSRSSLGLSSAQVTHPANAETACGEGQETAASRFDRRFGDTPSVSDGVCQLEAGQGLDERFPAMAEWIEGMGDGDHVGRSFARSRACAASAAASRALEVSSS